MSWSMAPGFEADGGAGNRTWVRGRIVATGLATTPQVFPLLNSEGVLVELMTGEWLTMSDLFIIGEPGEPNIAYLWADRTNDGIMGPDPSDVRQGIALWPSQPFIAPGFHSPFHWPAIVDVGGQPYGNRLWITADHDSLIGLTFLGWINHT